MTPDLTSPDDLNAEAAALDPNLTQITPLLNAGGLVALAGVLFYLHTNSLKAFREELRAEREQCHADHEKLGQTLAAIHEQQVKDGGRLDQIALGLGSAAACCNWSPKAIKKGAQ